MNSATTQNSLPACLEKQNVKSKAFLKWLHRKAMAHARRDRRRKFPNVSVSSYKKAILQAVEDACGNDFYTGKPLDWHRISTWENAEAALKRGAYKKEFWNLPTVDHDVTASGQPVFRLCSWRLNDAKNDQTIDELLQLADAVRAHRKRI